MSRLRTTCLRSLLLNQDSAKIVDIGQSRTGDHRITQSLKEGMAVVIGQTLTRFDAQIPGTSQGIGGKEGTGDVFLTIHTIGITG